jgi:GLPGLI family protein
MTKTIKLVGLLLLLSSTMVQAQIKGKANYLIKYKADFAIDSTNRDQRTKETHYLYTGSAVSFYVNEAIIRIDSMIREMQDVPQGNTTMMRRKTKSMREESKKQGIPGFMPKVYKDFSNGQVWVASRVSQDQFIYEEPNVPLKWEFENETKKIGDRESHKATTHFGGRNWVAWFTSEVPITDGPYVFSGLPGLVLELYDAQNDYHFSVISIEKLKQGFPIDSADDNYKKISKTKFIKAYSNFRKVPLGQYESMIRDLDIELPDPTTGEKVSPAEFIQRVKKLISSRNNYIELW